VRRQLRVVDAGPALAGGVSDDVEPGDFWSGAARSISVVGGCFFPSVLPAVDFSVGVALSIAAVGVCLRAFAAAFESCFAPPAASFATGADCRVAFDWTGWSILEAPSFVASFAFAPHTGNANDDAKAATADAIRSVFMFTSGTM
jgi:hypothetical protein